ncbi:MAG: diacylglycerol kinase family protein, partial [Bacillota bacterium]
MRHIFIMNPAAGKGKAGKVFLPQIIEASKRLQIDYEIHRTIAPGDAAHFVKSRCESREAQGESEETFRFYACGGDGTLNEVANGAYGHQNAEIAMIPAGTGNDFPRNFTNRQYFEDIERQILGQPKWIDLIRYEAAPVDELDEPLVRYGVNMFNIGLDCDAAEKVAQIKNYPFVPGPLAYGMGVAIVLGKKEGVNLEIKFDDGEIHSGDIMLIAIANGCYCGGGFKAVPKAIPDDGLIDVSIVGNITRRKFISLISKYKEGTHLDDPGTADIITYKKCKSLTVK